MTRLASAAAVQPLDVIQRWPRGLPLACVLAADGAARWSILALPTGERGTLEAIFQRPPTPPPLLTPTPPAPPLPASQTQHLPPFCGGWIGALSYEAGWDLDQGFQHRFRKTGTDVQPRRSQGPRSIWLRCDDALMFDHVHQAWWACGTGGQHLWNQVTDVASTTLLPNPTFDLVDLKPKSTEASYIDKVLRAKEYIRAGDAYQVNLAHTLQGSFTGCALRYFAERCTVAQPRYGAFMCFDEPRDGAGDKQRHAIASLSPELFLEFEPVSRKLTTRPMKGTREGGIDTTELIENLKDQAELAMIVDLMRNDLGTVSQLGSVKVEQARTIEHHGSSSAGGVVQATATISGVLRRDLTLFDAMTACFPCGSVTGAPKARAMQIIEELEDEPRGFYCGSMGFLSDTGAMRLSVAIRTMHIQGTALPNHAHAFTHASAHYSVGAGIVADSKPHEEWAETLVKARVVLV